VDANNIVELATLLGGVVVSVTGAISAIRARKAGDAAMGGDLVLAQAKAMQDITRVDPTYVQQAEKLRSELEAAKAQLKAHGIEG